MRAWAGSAVLFVAACGQAPAGDKAEPAAVAAAPSPGQWELTAEVTAFNKTDGGKPLIDTPVGTRSTEKLCVAAGERLPTDFFSGEGYKCTYGNYYVRNGTINLTLSCIHSKLNDAVLMSVDGSFEGDSVTFKRNLRTSFRVEGGAVIDSQVTGKRTGECAPADKAATK